MPRKPRHLQPNVRRRLVELSPRVKPGSSVRLWAYGFADLACLTGMTEAAVRQAVLRRQFDPSSLESVWRYVFHRRLQSLPSAIQNIAQHILAILP